MAFTSKYEALPDSQRAAMLTESKRVGAKETAKKWAETVGMSESRLYRVLLQEQGQGDGYDQDFGGLKPKEKVEKPKTQFQNPGARFKPAREERKLTKEDEAFLDKIEKGETTLEESSRIVARHVFEQMLRHPEDFRFNNFFQTELLKLKKEENQIKEGWGHELLGRLFGNKLPPRNCPQCGYNLSYQIEEGEVVDDDDKSISVTGNN